MKRLATVATLAALVLGLVVVGPTSASPTLDRLKVTPDLAELVARGGYGSFPIQTLVPDYQAATALYLVKLSQFDAGTLASLQSAGAQIRFTYPLIRSVAVVSPISAVAGISRMAQVQRLELDQLQQVLATTVQSTTSPRFADQQKRGTHDVGADALWAANPPVTGQGVTIGVTDTGIDSSHPDVGPKIKGFVDCQTVIPNIFVNDPILHGNDVGQCVPGPGRDDNGHGTHVSGIAAGSGLVETDAAGSGLYPGMAPDASLVGAKVCSAAGFCLNSSVMAGFQTLAADPKDGGLGADIINVSLGGGRFYFSPIFGAEQETNISSESELVNALSQKYNVLFTISAGNSGPTLQSVANPSVSSQALSVGAAVADWDLNHPVEQTAHGELGNIRPEAAAAGATGIAQFSSRGPSGDRLIKPEVTAPGVYVISAEAKTGAEISAGDIAHGHNFSTDPNYAVLSGTSMSAPSAAGVAALVWSGYKTRTGKDPAYYQLKAALSNTAWTRAFEGSVIGLISGIKAKRLGMDPAELFPLRNTDYPYVGTSGEGAGRVNAPAALAALTSGVTAYTPAGKSVRSTLPNWSLDDIAQGQRASQTFVLHGGPRLAGKPTVKFSVQQEAEPLGVLSAPAGWFQLPGGAATSAGKDTSFQLGLSVPTNAAPGMYEATVIGQVSLGGGVTENLRIPVQFFVTLPENNPAQGAGSFTEGPIWASGTTDYSAVGFENPLGDILTDWTMIPVRVPKNTKQVDLTVYDTAGNDHMDVFAFTDYGVEIDSTVSFFLHHAVPGGLLYSPTTKDDPSQVTLFDGDDYTPPCEKKEKPVEDGCVRLPTTIWLAVSDSGPDTVAFSTYHLDVDWVAK